MINPSIRIVTALRSTFDARSETARIFGRQEAMRMNPKTALIFTIVLVETIALPWPVGQTQHAVWACDLAGTHQQNGNDPKEHQDSGGETDNPCKVKSLDINDVKDVGLKNAMKEQARWLDAIPKSLRPIWPEYKWESGFGIEKLGNPDNPDRKAFFNALGKDVPEIKKRIQILFAWLGTGTTAWIGGPANELVPNYLLMDYSTSDLIAAAQDPTISDQQVEGAAQFFASYEFAHERPDDAKQMPPLLKDKFLQHVIDTMPAETAPSGDLYETRSDYQRNLILERAQQAYQ